MPPPVGSWGDDAPGPENGRHQGPGRVLLIGGPPRSGRSEILARRAVELVEGGVDPGAVLVLGASPVAARSLATQLSGLSQKRSEGTGRRRGAGRLAAPGPGPVPGVLTVGSLCLALLREAAEESELDPFFAVASEVDRLVMLVESFGPRDPGRGGARVDRRTLGVLARAIGRIDVLKGALVGAESYAERFGRADGADGSGAAAALGLPDLAAIYLEHERLLSAQGALDSGDLVLRAGALLAAGSPARNRLGERHSHLLVEGILRSTGNSQRRNK